MQVEGSKRALREDHRRTDDLPTLNHNQEGIIFGEGRKIASLYCSAEPSRKAYLLLQICFVQFNSWLSIAGAGCNLTRVGAGDEQA
jgi:hypothetical protein